MTRKARLLTMFLTLYACAMQAQTGVVPASGIPTSQPILGGPTAQTTTVITGDVVAPSAGGSFPILGSGTVTYSSGVFVEPPTARYKNAREYALSRIKEFEDYQKKSKNWSMNAMYYATFNGARQSFGVKDGEVSLENITLEDAFLLLYAEQSDKMLAEARTWDREEAARKDVPPSKIKYKGVQWTLASVPDWSSGAILGTTYCGLKYVKALDTDPDKRGTVMHEMMHVVAGCQDNRELHSLIQKVAPGLVALLRENPDLVTYLTGAPKESDFHAHSPQCQSFLDRNSILMGYVDTERCSEWAEKYDGGDWNADYVEEMRGNLVPAIGEAAYNAQHRSTAPATVDAADWLYTWSAPGKGGYNSAERHTFVDVDEAYKLIGKGGYHVAPNGDGWPPPMPSSAKAWLVLDSTQAKLPGNEHLKPCQPGGTISCYDPALPHITNRLYNVKEHCETSEGVKCTGLYEYWVPIGKPVFYDETPTEGK